MSPTINASIIGVTGYTGLEIVRLLLLHPNIKLQHVVSANAVGQSLSTVWPHLAGICNLTLEALDIPTLAADSDVIFLALPHGESQHIMPALLNTGCKIIDLAGDFRLQQPTAYQQYYGSTHTYPEGVKQFTYGLPELFATAISQARYIANPGCFALTAQLALYPLRNIIQSAHVLGITGSSGSGKQPKNTTHHPIREHNLQSYKIGQHQHIPEILQTLGLAETQLTFVPTSGPFTRGIHLTAFVQPNTVSNQADVNALFTDAYQAARFIRIKPQVAMAEVIGSNYVDLSVQVLNQTIVVQATIDNLVKGAAGTAIQNCNLMFGLASETGLEMISPLLP